MNESPKRARGGQPGNKNSTTHGLCSLKAMLDGDGLDRRTSLYRALAEKDEELVNALGGDPSPQEKAIIADTVKHMLYAATLDHYLLSLKSLVRKGRVHGVLSERTRIGAHVRENLKTLGLKRVAKEVDLATQLKRLQDPSPNGDRASSNG
ncbi:MAG TPA: hypothetical protein VGK77_28335 [Candidatus Binatia bacterium]|jgi:hypothetical protein